MGNGDGHGGQRVYVAGQVARAFGLTPQAVKARVQRGTLPGWAPSTGPNPLDTWVVDADAADTAAGRPLELTPVWLVAPPPDPDHEPLLWRAQMAEADASQARDELVAAVKAAAEDGVRAATARADRAEAEVSRLRRAVAALVSHDLPIEPI